MRAVIDGESRLPGRIAAERRLSLEVGERVEITGLVVDGMSRFGGVGRTLVLAAEAWAAELCLDVVFVRSNVQRQASHPSYEGMATRGRRASTSAASAWFRNAGINPPSAVP